MTSERHGADAAVVELRDISKSFGHVAALNGVTMNVHPGEVTCLVGDNGAGKSTLTQILAGVHRPDSGQLLVDGEPVKFAGPRDALALGISTVFQDLAMIPLISIVRNFFLGREPARFVAGIRVVDWEEARRLAQEEMARIGIDARDLNQPVGTLSGGERQSVAIARAIHFGARVLVLDEPTSALGLKEATRVLAHISNARGHGIGIVFISHNLTHAWEVGDRFVVLNRGTSYGEFERADLTKEELRAMMEGLPR